MITTSTWTMTTSRRKQEDYALGAATLALASSAGDWSVSAFVHNLTDKDYYSQRTRRDTEIIASAGEGRRYGFRVNMRFETPPGAEERHDYSARQSDD